MCCPLCGCAVREPTKTPPFSIVWIRGAAGSGVVGQKEYPIVCSPGDKVWGTKVTIAHALFPFRISLWNHKRRPSGHLELSSNRCCGSETFKLDFSGVSGSEIATVTRDLPSQSQSFSTFLVLKRVGWGKAAAK